MVQFDDKIVHDEKYISIPYDIWVNKYKILEEENLKLKDDIKNYRVNIRVSINSLSSNETKDIGYINFNIDKGYSVQIKDFSALLQAIEEQCAGYNRFYIGKYEVEKQIAIIDTHIKKLIERKESIDKKLKQLPAIIRWLFKI